MTSTVRPSFGRTTFWHASAKALPTGTILLPRSDYEARWDALSAGRILEGFRPASSLPHRDAVFLCEDPQDCDNCGAECEWLYEARPDARLERHDMEWSTLIDCLTSDGSPPDAPEIAELARRYWTGEASDHPTWEILTPQATILSRQPF